jgi:hypothetical protein
VSEASITIDINKLIDNYQFNEELVKKMYNNDYKQLALDLAKENQKLTFENLIKENIIKEVREYITSQKLHKIQDTTGALTYQEIKLLQILDKGENNVEI